MKKSIVITVDIMGFTKLSHSQSPEKTANYITSYYKLVQSLVARYNWRFVKGIGDCVLISADLNVPMSRLNEFYETLSKEYDVNVFFRKCEYCEQLVAIGDYSCLDIFGKDINNLFLDDPSTVKIG